MKTNKNTITYALLAIGGIYLLTRKRKSMLIPEVEKFILKMEGGLTNNPADSAAKNPSPTPQKWHTNKGITWSTFVANAPSLGYEPSVNNFLVMPSSIWQAIYRKKYLEPVKITGNEVLNAYLSLWYWGGWDRKYMPFARVKAVLDSKAPARSKLRALVDLRKEYFDNIVKAFPKNQQFLKGWKARAEEFYTTFEKYC